MVVGGLAILASILVLKFHYHRTNTPVPALLSKFSTKYLAAIVCYKKGPDQAGYDEKDEEQVPEENSMVNTNGQMVPTAVQDWITGNLQISDEFGELFGRLLQKNKSIEITSDIQNNWEEISKIWDRFFMLTFSAINLLSFVFLICSLRTDMLSTKGF